MKSTARCAALLACLLVACGGEVTITDPNDGSDGDSERDGNDDGDGNDDERDGSGGDGSSNDGDSGDGSSSDGDSGDGSWNDGDDGDGSWSDGNDGDGSEGDGSEGDGGDGPIDEENLDWREARLTNYESYPEEGSEECEDFSGCEYSGHFAGLDGQQSLEWVMSNNIAAVHSDDFDMYLFKTLRVRDGQNSIDVTVYDMCADSDCSGCCTRNKDEAGFLIDLEHYTAEKFGTFDGIVEWACIDC